MSLEIQPSASERPHPKRIVIVAPSRLHFGLLRVGNGPRRFGGAGLMLSEPRLCIAAEAAPRFAAEGDLADRVRVFAQRWAEFYGVRLPDLSLKVSECPPQHSGLGVGTQLGLSVAALLHHWTDIPISDPTQMARSVKRGLRSSVGAYGFHRGGFIVERGKAEHEWLAPLDLHVHLPASWRFLLVRPESNGPAVSGNNEQRAFDALHDDPQLESQLEQILRNEVAPAATQGDFDAFARSIQEYGRLAGSSFAKFQGGPYNGELLNRLVAALQRAGAKGVGQTSWGPTLFCCFRDQQQANAFAIRISGWREFGPLNISVSAASPNGADVTVTEQCN